ncbi:hypothetical protein MPSEU_000234700 [Mayamaea pseudoterrestris]|nr:hypothetical protein MPSEU_000234700 [Mayamaea pseudoterrestris]
MASLLGRLRLVFILLGSLAVINLVRRNKLSSHQQKTANESTIKEPSAQVLVKQDDLLVALGIHIGQFPEWNASTPIPCLPLDDAWNKWTTQKSKATTGILFVKTPKAASTTAASVTLRLAYTAAQRNNETLCKNRVQHSVTHRMNYDMRDKHRSILWSIVRDPTARALSEYFHFHVSRKHQEPSDENVFAYLTTKRNDLPLFQLKYLAFHKDVEDPARVIEEIFKQYNFIGVAERFDESVVVLQMLLGLSAFDVMYLSAKSSGGYDDGRSNGGKCILIQETVVSANMKEYLFSDEWKAIVYWDEILHKAANYALDLRIEQLGAEEFQRNLAKFQELKRQVDLVCATKVKLPCTSSGEKVSASKTDCIFDDMGCGFECMDTFK